MIACVQQGWQRRIPFLELSREELSERLRRMMPDVRVIAAEPLTGGLRNSSYRVQLAGRQNPVVVRFYRADASACGKELALGELVRGRAPIPATLASDPDATPPFAVVEWVDGVAFDSWLETATPEEAGQAAVSAGAILAGIHSISFPEAGFLGRRLEVVEPFRTGGDGWSAYMASFLFERGVERELGADLTARLWRAALANAHRLDVLGGDRSLVHADYKPQNLLLRREQGVWSVAAVLDWEFALSGPPLLDVGLFLRFEKRLPSTYRRGFVQGYVGAGGHLPRDWRPLSRLLDLLSMCSLLEHMGGEGGTLRRDVRELISSTLDDLNSD